MRSREADRLSFQLCPFSLGELGTQVATIFLGLTEGPRCTRAPLWDS